MSFPQQKKIVILVTNYTGKSKNICGNFYKLVRNSDAVFSIAVNQNADDKIFISKMIKKDFLAIQLHEKNEVQFIKYSKYYCFVMIL